MSIISVEEFKQKTGSGPSTKEKSYQNRILNSGPVFSKAKEQLALSYCQYYLNKKRICFVVDRAFVDRCQQILIQLIGPIAPLLCQQTFTQNPHIAQSKFIELMIQQIPDATKVTEFQQQLQKKLRQ